MSWRSFFYIDSLLFARRSDGREFSIRSKPYLKKHASTEKPVERVVSRFPALSRTAGRPSDGTVRRWVHRPDGAPRRRDAIYKGRISLARRLR
jgi:hypothetical protein